MSSILERWRRSPHGEWKDAVPKIVIYVDSEVRLRRTRGYLIQVLKHRGYDHKQALITVGTCGSDARDVDVDKQRIHEEFPSEESDMRVSFATATIAPGMGMYLKGVFRVI